MAFYLLFLLASCFVGNNGFQWSPGLADVVYKCSGQDAELLWKYTTQAGDVTHDIEWFAQTGPAQELIALHTHGIFDALHNYASRLQYVPNAGIVLTNVTSGDTGNYSVEISNQDLTGVLFTHSRSILLQVTRGDELLTTNSRLHVSVGPEPVHNATSGQWALGLTCGNLSLPSDLALIVEWQTPSGDIIRKMTQGGLTRLHVTSGGRYTCRVPQQACVTSAVEAAVTVDETEARLALLEAELRALRNRSMTLEQSNSALLALNAALDQRLHEGSLWEGRVRDLEQQTAAVLRAQAATAGLVANLSHTLGQLASRQVGFSATLDHDGLHPDRLSFRGHVTDPGFSEQSGTFTAPVRGLYFLLVSVAPQANSVADVDMKKDGELICTAYGALSGQASTCGTLQQLQVGAQVWLESSQRLYRSGTHFSGFLLAAN